MCEVLIRVVDNVQTDPILNAQCTKAGDIIHVAADGWPWGKEELINPEWRIVKLPGVSPSLLLDLLEVEFDGAGRIARTRKKFINFKSDATILDWLTNQGQVITLSTNNLKNKFQSLKTVKPASVVVVG